MANYYKIIGLLFVVGASCLVSAQARCLQGEDLCGQTCYNPVYKQCLGNSSGVQYPCFKAESLCANDNTTSPTCYDPKIQECHALTKSKVCFKGQSLCEGAIGYSGSEYPCYKPNSENCFPPRKGDLYARICKKGEIPCGYARYCFDPSIQDCIKEDSRRLFLDFSIPCYKGQHLCGSTCYNNASHECLSYNASAMQYHACEIGQRLCGPYDCYNPLNDDCVEGKVCPIGQENC